MPTYTEHYQQIEARRSHTGKCPVCGKKVRRSHTFMHTVNPWNRKADGTVRTVWEVGEAVNAEADRWVPDFTHAACKENADA